MIGKSLSPRGSPLRGALQPSFGEIFDGCAINSSENVPSPHRPKTSRHRKASCLTKETAQRENLTARRSSGVRYRPYNPAERRREKARIKAARVELEREEREKAARLEAEIQARRAAINKAKAEHPIFWRHSLRQQGLPTNTWDPTPAKPLGEQVAETAKGGALFLTTVFIQMLGAAILAGFAWCIFRVLPSIVADAIVVIAAWFLKRVWPSRFDMLRRRS